MVLGNGGDERGKGLMKGTPFSWRSVFEIWLVIDAVMSFFLTHN